MLFGSVPYIPELYLKYQQETLTTKNALITSGILTTNPAIEAEFRKGGRTVDLPFFGDLTGDDELLSDITGLTPEEMDGDVQTGVRLLRGKAWKASDLAAELAGDDPMKAIARRTGFYWNTRLQITALKVLDGCFLPGGPIASSHVYGGTSTANNGGAFLKGIAKLGDSGNQLRMIAMHSAVYYDLAGLDLSVAGAFSTSQIDTRISEENPEFASYLRRGVIIDDSLPVEVGTGTGSTNVYTSYLFAPGALAYANAPAKVPVETERDKFKGIDFLINRTQYMIHPNGISWRGNSAASGPSNDELSTPTNWEKVYRDDKNIKMVAVKTFVPNS
jgi:hypothetical protein